MYKYLAFILLLAFAGCRAKKESLESASFISKVDSNSRSFKGSLNTTSFKHAVIDFTTDEFEYPEQTPEEKAKGIPAKPRLKKRTTGKMISNDSTKSQQRVEGQNNQVKRETDIETKTTHTQTTPYWPLRLWLIGLVVIVMVVLYINNKFNLVARIKNFLKKL